MAPSATMDTAGLTAVASASGSKRDRMALGLPEVDHVCFVMADGPGARNLDARSDHASALRSMTRFEPFTTIAPSTTATTITVVGMGGPPGKIVMTGYSLCSPTNDRPFSLVKWDDPEFDPFP